jgi:hypothetical protein
MEGTKEMKKLVYLLLAMALILAFTPVVASAQTEIQSYSTDLIAGQHYDIGDVLVWNDADYLYVQYLVDDADWCLTLTHLEVATSLDGIPQTKKGNPIPGKFSYSSEHACVTDFTYQIERTWDIGAELYIAAHAEAQQLLGYEGDMQDLIDSLPAQVSTKVYPPPGDGFGEPSYFDVEIAGGTNLDGMHDAWCVDTDHVMRYLEWFTADVYASYEPLPPGLIEFPENLDLVNWILNQHFVGQPSSCDGDYTYGDVQRAIWELIEDNQAEDGLGPWSQCRVDEILAGAWAYGEGYLPGCGDLMGVILVPIADPTVQPFMIGVEVPCVPVYGEETAWAAGFEFPGNNWAMYFTYTFTIQAGIRDHR